MSAGLPAVCDDSPADIIHSMVPVSYAMRVLVPVLFGAMIAVSPAVDQIGD